jgi:hypothetical protein
MCHKAAAQVKLQAKETLGKVVCVYCYGWHTMLSSSHVVGTILHIVDRFFLREKADDIKAREL